MSRNLSTVRMSTAALATAGLLAGFTGALSAAAQSQVTTGQTVHLRTSRSAAGSEMTSQSTTRWAITGLQGIRQSAPPITYPIEQGLTPRAIALHRAAMAAWPQITTYYGYRNDPSSDHYQGRALDLMIPSYTSTTGRALGTNVASWAVSNQKRLNVDYVIWDQQIWSLRRASEGWRPMADRGSDTANHKNHVHISVLAW